MAAEAHLVILYDGVCGLCNRLNRFVLRRDRAGVFRFAALQGRLAATVLARHGRDPQHLDTVYVVLNFDQTGEQVLERSEAVLFILRRIGGAWGAVAAVMSALPRGLRNLGYDLAARNRYRVFGKYAACPLPQPGERERFLD